MDDLTGDPPFDGKAMSKKGRDDKAALEADGWAVFDPPEPGLLGFAAAEGGARGAAWGPTPEAALACFAGLMVDSP